MVDPEAMPKLRELSKRQWGLFTAAQARQYGIAASELARRANTGELFRAHRGVYGFTEDTVDMVLFENWAAQWLALKPAADIDARRAAPDCILSHASAASIRELGSIVSYGLFLTGPRRINVRSPQVHTYTRDIGARGVDWDIFEGLPVATPGRIVADLARADLDGSHQGTVISDIIEEGLMTLEEVGKRLDPYASRWGSPNGIELAQRFAAGACRPLQV